MVEINDDLASYYTWLFSRRYNIALNPPQRGPHITFINDSLRDLSEGGKLTKEQIIDKWNRVKKKWNGKKIEIKLFLDPRTDDNHWWFNIPHEDREELHAIRTELGLGRPFWGLHMSIGIIHPHDIDHSAYIHDTLINGCDESNVRLMQSWIDKGVLKFKDGKFIEKPLKKKR